MIMRSHSALIALLVVCLLSGIVACNRDADRILEELKKLEADNYDNSPPDKERESELLASIRFLEVEVNRTVDAGFHLGTYYKMVAIEFRNREMYGLAADYFERALGVYPTNPYLAYWAGVSFAQLATSYQQNDRKRETFDSARKYYEYALDLDFRYVEALYALSVLLVFEYDEPAAAEPLLERVLAIESRNFNGMFLLARIHASFGRFQEAILLYTEIIQESADESKVTQARRNRDSLLEGSLD